LLATALTLCSGSLEHLAVLFLAHALTALLDERSHNAATLADRRNGPDLRLYILRQIRALVGLDGSVDRPGIGEITFDEPGATATGEAWRQAGCVSERIARLGQFRGDGEGGWLEVVAIGA